jgi:hypothetical protein
VVTEESLTAQDWYQTFAALAGASDKVPTGRPLDGIDASQFLLGTSEHTGRETVVFFGPDGSLMSVKWNNVKVWLRYTEGVDKPIVQPQFPLVFDLGSDPGENYNLFSDKTDMGWMIGHRPAGRRRIPAEHRPVPQHQARRGLHRLLGQGTMRGRGFRPYRGEVAVPRSVQGEAGSPGDRCVVAGPEGGRRPPAGPALKEVEELLTATSQECHPENPSQPPSHSPSAWLRASSCELSARSSRMGRWRPAVGRPVLVVTGAAAPQGRRRGRRALRLPLPTVPSRVMPADQAGLVQPSSVAAIG